MVSLLRYFALTFATSWICWFAAGLLWRGTGSPGSPPGALGGAAFLLGVFMPGIVAVAEVGRLHGATGVRSLLRRILQARVAPRYFVLAAGYFAAVKLAVALLYRVITGAWPPFGPVPWLVMAGSLLVSTGFQAGEEVGWRGYALPRLSHHVGLAGASVLLGVVWALWHLPQFFFFPQGDTFGQSFPVWLLQVTAISVALAWLYWRTGGSLLLVMLMHAGVNNTNWVPSGVPGATDPLALSTSLVAWLTAGVLWVVAGFFLLGMRGASLRAVDPVPRIDSGVDSAVPAST